MHKLLMRLRFLSTKSRTAMNFYLLLRCISTLQTLSIQLYGLRFL
jgi:hypothetical protein